MNINEWMKKMSEKANEEPRFLTVGRLISDLQAFDKDIEVAVVIQGGGLSIPINHLMKLDAQERKLALLIIHEANVRRALDANANMQAVN